MRGGLLWGAVLLFGTACSMSDRTYCEERWSAWERAFPDRTQRDGERDGEVASCVEATAAQLDGERDCRVACLREHALGAVDPRDEYSRMIACEERCARASAEAEDR